MGIGFELVCEKGTIIFDGERLNEIEIFRQSSAGFERVLINADHPDYGAFIPAPGARPWLQPPENHRAEGFPEGNRGRRERRS